MTDYKKEIIGYIEVHDIDGIRTCFENGLDPNDLFRGEPLINELTSEYLRGPSFKECVRTFVDFGLQYHDDSLLAVLLDDYKYLELAIGKDKELIHKQFTLRSAYTPLDNVTLLHICAEFNHIKFAQVLVNNGADINARGGIDEYGFGGQTPIFHTVNQNMNQSEEMMNILLEHKCDLDLTLRGIIWGKSYEWQTLIPSINPVSYAMMGLLPQMHRSEKVISNVVSILLKYKYGVNYKSPNVPNKYLSS